MSDYIASRRIEKAVVDTARRHGIDGDPLAEVPSIGTLDQELLIVALGTELPRDIRRDPLAKGLVRNIVLSARGGVAA